MASDRTPTSPRAARPRRSRSRRTRPRIFVGRWKIIRDVEHRGYSVSQVLEKIKQREGDNKLYIEPQKNNSDIIIRFFTDDNFNYLILDENPNIYLKITSNKKIYKFIEALNKFEIPYSFLKEEIDTYSLVFYKISNFIPLLIHFSKNEIKISKNDYYPST